MSKPKNSIGRRQFLKGSAFLTMAGGFVSTPLGAADKGKNGSKQPQILNYNSEMKYRRLGNSDIYLSVLTLGGLGLEAPVAHYAIDKGVNLVHMSNSYNNGNSIRKLGEVLKTKRDKVYIALKDNFRDLDDVLRKLHTDYVDFLMFNRHSVSAVKDPGNLERFEKYKKQGKVRFAGLTSHNDVKACVAAGLNLDYYSLIMPVTNQPSFEAMTEEMRIAQSKGVGIMAMKTMKGINDSSLETPYLKKVLANPAITTVLKGFRSFAMFDSYLKASQEALSLEEDNLLYRYAQQNRTNNCMMCGECEKICPKNVEISKILRSKDYYYQQLEDWETAATTYREISTAARGDASCYDCRLCEPSCPNNISIVDRLNEASHIFSSFA